MRTAKTGPDLRLRNSGLHFLVYETSDTSNQYFVFIGKKSNKAVIPSVNSLFWRLGGDASGI